MRDDIKAGLLVGFVLFVIAAGVTSLWQAAAVMGIVGFVIGVMVARDETDDYNSTPGYTPVPQYVEDFMI